MQQHLEKRFRRSTVAVNERAVEADRQYFAQSGVKCSYGMYYLHNLQYLLYTRAMQGTDRRRPQGGAAVVGCRERDGRIYAGDGGHLRVVCDYGSSTPAALGRNIGDYEAHGEPGVGRILAACTRAGYVAKQDYGAAKGEQAEFERLSKTMDRNFPWERFVK